MPRLLLSLSILFIFLAGGREHAVFTVRKVQIYYLNAEPDRAKVMKKKKIYIYERETKIVRNNHLRLSFV